MSSNWADLPAGKVKRNLIRLRLEQKKKERLDNSSGNIKSEPDETKVGIVIKQEPPPDVEELILAVLCDSQLELPISSTKLLDRLDHQVDRKLQEINDTLQSLSDQKLITLDTAQKDTIDKLVTRVDVERISAIKSEAYPSLKRKFDSSSEDESAKKLATNDIMSLLSMPSTLEKQNKEVGVEILELLSKPTAKEISLAEKFKSAGGTQVHKFCPHGTKIECTKIRDNDSECKLLHFKKIIQSHTDENFGDCSFLNTCFHMDSCKYVHYEVDSPSSGNGAVATNPSSSAAVHKISTTTPTSSAVGTSTVSSSSLADNPSILSTAVSPSTETAAALQKLTPSKRPIAGATLFPAQWIQCDLRYLDMTVLGKFAVIMADPPWDIHMHLPYGTMSDDEMRQLGVPALQDDGLIFLWVTGRAMELGRECLKLWGYERVDELIWVKTNQLQRIIRTGRTGHWLNHGKEHCLVGMKGHPKNLNRGLDCDVIVAEVRATSHKPDEIYGIIERLSPGTRKIELFGRPHNAQPNWITLGNQLDGIHLVDPELVNHFRWAQYFRMAKLKEISNHLFLFSYRKRYPDGNCMAPAQSS